MQHHPATAWQAAIQTSWQTVDACLVSYFCLCVLFVCSVCVLKICTPRLQTYLQATQQLLAELELVKAQNKELLSELASTTRHELAASATVHQLQAELSALHTSVSRQATTVQVPQCASELHIYADACSPCYPVANITPCPGLVSVSGWLCSPITPCLQ